jgi:hypothetical protein
MELWVNSKMVLRNNYEVFGIVEIKEGSYYQPFSSFKIIKNNISELRHGQTNIKYNHSNEYIKTLYNGGFERGDHLENDCFFTLSRDKEALNVLIKRYYSGGCINPLKVVKVIIPCEERIYFSYSSTEFNEKKLFVCTRKAIFCD